MPGKNQTSKRVICEQCAGTGLVRRITTYPVLLTGPLQGKQIHAGQAKVDRNIAMGIRLFLGQLH